MFLGADSQLWPVLISIFVIVGVASFGFFFERAFNFRFPGTEQGGSVARKEVQKDECHRRC